MKKITKILPKRIYLQRGLTLAEIIVAIGSAILIIGGAYSVYAVANKSFKAGSEKFDLTQNAKVPLEKIVRELRETTEIITQLPTEKNDPNLPPPTEITFLDANYSKYRYITYYLTGSSVKRRVSHYYLPQNPQDWLKYSDQLSSQIDEDEIIAQDISLLVFYGQNPIIIDIRAQSGNDKFDLNTKIYQRNH